MRTLKLSQAREVMMFSRESVRLFSASSCKLLPRPTKTASPKWKKYTQPKSDENSILETKFGGIFYDHKEKKTISDDAITVSDITKHQRKNKEDDDNIFFESSSEDTLVMPVHFEERIADRKSYEEMNRPVMLETEQSSSANAAAAKPKKVKREPAETMKASHYVKQLRRESIMKQKEEAAARTYSKEQEVVSIGKSLQKRVSNAIPLNKIDCDSQKPSGSQEKEPANMYSSGAIDLRFLPLDLTKLPSAEVISMLRKGVIYDKDDIVALYKPFGLPMYDEGDEKAQHSVERYLPSLAEFVSCQTLHLVHRLDKTTSGLLLLAKSDESLEFLKEKFRQRQVKKCYWAIVNGTPSPTHGVINIPLCEANINGRFRMTVAPEYKAGIVKKKKLPMASVSVPAVTEFQTLKSRGNRALLEISLITGYKHQIRAHLGLGMGCPILGDHKYSSVTFDGRPQKVHGDILERLGVRRSKARDLPLLLHAKRLAIPLMNDEEQSVVIDSWLPHHFVRIMKKLSLSPPSAMGGGGKKRSRISHR